MATSALLYIASFFFLWVGSGFVVSAVNRFSKNLKISSFAFSFFVLGMLTSIPEFAVGMTAISQKQPEVFVGNLIGSIPVIFFLIIPVLAILGNGVSLRGQLSLQKLFFAFLVILSPSFFVLDRRVGLDEGLIMVGLYAALFFIVQKKNGILDAGKNNILKVKKYSYIDILKILLGVAIAFIASRYIVGQTLAIATYFDVSPFVISLLVLSLGTNLPEFSLAVRGVLSKKKEVAFGDYVGSAATNTFLFGLFVMMSGGQIATVSNFWKPFVIMVIGMAAFLYFARSKKNISRKEGAILLFVYILFLALEFWQI